VLRGGLALYVAGAVASIMAPTLGTMFVARFVWGLGAAGPRVSTMAAIRDGFEGEQMAKQMSLLMAIFLLVPAIGPTLSAGILLVGPWQAVFWMCAVAAGVVALLVTRIPETLAVDARRSLSIRSILDGYRLVLTTPGSVLYLISLTALFGAFLTYLASSELIVDLTFGLGPWFPAFFGGLALVMLVGMIANTRLVERIGIHALLGYVFVASAVLTGTMLVVALATDGRPPFWLFTALLAAVLLFHQMLIPNLNAAAMRPLADVAGSGTAVLNMVPGVIGAVIAEALNRQFDGTILPFSAGFAGAVLVAWLAWWRASRATGARRIPATPR